MGSGFGDFVGKIAPMVGLGAGAYMGNPILGAALGSGVGQMLNGAPTAGGAQQQIQSRPRGSQQIGTYKGIPIFAYEPDPIQTGSTTTQQGGQNGYADAFDLLSGLDFNALTKKYAPAGTTYPAGYGVDPTVSGLTMPMNLTG